jgi:hypothetical protein
MGSHGLRAIADDEQGLGANQRPMNCGRAFCARSVWRGRSEDTRLGLAVATEFGGPVIHGRWASSRRHRDVVRGVVVAE